MAFRRSRVRSPPAPPVLASPLSEKARGAEGGQPPGFRSGSASPHAFQSLLPGSTAVVHALDKREVVSSILTPATKFTAVQADVVKAPD